MAKTGTDLIFLGATPYPEIAEVVRDINKIKHTYRIRGILDDNPALHGKTIEDAKVLGPLDMATGYEDALFVLGIGSYRARMVRFDIISRLGIPHERYATLIHPAAKVYSSASVGRGCILYPGALVFADARVQDFVQVLPYSGVGTRSRVCEGALIAGFVSIISDAIIGPYTHIGTSSIVGEKRRIGAGAQVGMGCIILRDVPPGAFVFGNPPQVLRRDVVPPELMAMWDRITRSEE